MKADSTTINHNETSQSTTPRLTSPPPTDRQIQPRTPRDQTQPKLPKRTQAEKRIDFLLQKHFDNDPDFRPLLNELAEYVPTQKKKYLAWLVKHWTSDWTPSKTELHRLKTCLEIHRKGAKYFSPLSWTGLRLEDSGYHVDIFRYTPVTLQSVHGKIEEIIRTDEEDKQIRKGNLVVTAGAEVAYQDEKWTLLRVRTKAALKRLGQGCGWCVCGDGMNGYSFPFDFLLTADGERYLANGREIADRWNTTPPHNLCAEIDLVRAIASDGYDRAAALVRLAIQKNERHHEENEKEILRYPEQAIRYAEKVLGGAWPEFEKSVRVATLSARHAVEYAILCRRERWPRFENKIKRSTEQLYRYRKAFPGSIPKNDKEIFQDKLAEWRRANGNLHCPWQHWSLQWQVENRQRNIDFEIHLLRSYAEASVKRYARLVASLATSILADEYRERFLSYFTGATDENTMVVNRQLAPLICKHVRCRIPELEEHIKNDSRLALAYALGNGERFEEGEESIRQDQQAWWEYCRKLADRLSPVRPKKVATGQHYLPTNVRTAWM